MKKIILLLFLFLVQLSFASPPPTGVATQYFCSSEIWRLNDLIVNSTTGEVFWFSSDDNSNTQLNLNTIFN